MSGKVGYLGKGQKDFFQKGENNIWNRRWLGLAHFSPVFRLYRDHLIDMHHKSVDSFLYNGNTGLNDKVDSWLR